MGYNVVTDDFNGDTELSTEVMAHSGLHLGVTHPEVWTNAQ